MFISVMTTFGVFGIVIGMTMLIYLVLTEQNCYTAAAAASKKDMLLLYNIISMNYR